MEIFGILLELVDGLEFLGGLIDLLTDLDSRPGLTRPVSILGLDRKVG